MGAPAGWARRGVAVCGLARLRATGLPTRPRRARINHPISHESPTLALALALTLETVLIVILRIAISHHHSIILLYVRALQEHTARGFRAGVFPIPTTTVWNPDLNLNG